MKSATTIINSLTGSRQISALVYVALAICSPAIASAQNPFDNAGGPPVSSPPTSATRTTGADDLGAVDPGSALIINSIANSSPQTAEQLVMAIDTLMNIDADVEAKQYLLNLAALQANDAQYYALHRNTGTPFFIELSSREAFQPEGREFAEKVLDAAWRYSYDPARLDALARQLGDPNIYVRSDALDKLKKAGESGAAAIINVLADESAREQFPYLRTALSKYGNDAAGPLIGAVFSDNPDIRLEATQALRFVSTYQAQTALYHPLLAGESQRVRAVAQQSLTHLLGTTPSNQQVERALFEAAREFGSPIEIDPYEPESFRRVWKWDNGMQVERVRKDVARQIMAARLSEALLFARPDYLNYQQLYLVSALQGMKSAGGIDQPLDSAFADSIQRRFTSDQVSLALHNSIERNLPAGAVAACELLERYNEDRVLRSYAGQPSPLVEALKYGDQRVTVAAAKTISSLSLRQPFAGSSHYLSSLVYLAGSQGHRKALVAHNNPAVAQTMAVAVSRAGYIPVSAINAQRVFSVATTDADIELILISDTINQPDYLELVQLLRSDPRSRLTPIGILYQMLDRPRIEHFVRNDQLTMALPTTADPAIVARQLSHLRLRAGYDDLKSETRLINARWASEQLAQLTQRESPAVKFDFAAHQEAISLLLYKSDTSAASSTVLGRVGTPFAQRQLISVASQSGISPEIRRAAITALAKAFDDNGILLTKSEILHQYDVYNASDSETEESREILGSILDLFEKR